MKKLKIFKERFQVTFFRFVCLLSPLALIVLVHFVSCEKEDMSNIDFRNIENLSAQPLPVIKKCVQGKWKLYSSHGGCVGPYFHTNIFVNIYEDRIDIDSLDVIKVTYQYKWVKTRLPDGTKTWVTWEKEYNQGIWFFDRIKNDSLDVINANLPIIGSVFVRVK